VSAANYPGWWITRGVVDTNASAEDYAVCTSGQLKTMALQAMNELDADLPGGAGDAIHAMVNGWLNNTANAQDYSAINAGQLKTVAAPFYDCLRSNNWPCILPDGMTTNQNYPWSGTGAQDYSMANNGQVKYVFSFSVVNATLKNPVDSNGDGKVNDFAGSTGDRTGSAFNYDRSLTNLCTIPCRVQILPDTPAMRSMLAGKVTTSLPQISNAGFTSTLSWDHSVAGDPSTGSLAYNTTSGLWEATATYTGLPGVPSNSYGRVPLGLHNLLYGNRTAIVSVQNPSGGGTLCTNATKYEVYFGDSLVIGGTNMAETTLNYTSHIAPIIGSDNLLREIFDKMNCATETFSFSDDTKAAQNFAMRYGAVLIMSAMNAGTFDVWYSDPYPRCGNTTNNPATTSWIIGPYWRPANTSDMFCSTFYQLSGTTAHDAINNVTPYRGECAGAMEICIFTAADTALGTSQFNAIHPTGSLGLANWGSDWWMHMGTMSDTNTLVPGDYIYMKNQDDYATRATNSPALWQGENCVYQGLNASNVGTFGGLGGGMSYLTEDTMRNSLKAGYERDCPPPGVTNPDTAIRFTVRYRAKTGN